MVDRENPDEIVMLYHCPGCGMTDVAGNAKRCGHVSEDTGDQLMCRRCKCRLKADSFIDYVDMRVVDYE
jgi:hypothetical protein